MQYHAIDTADELEDYCKAIARSKSIAFDTEFVSEHTFRPVLCLIQVAADGELAVIDPLAIGDVKPFWEVVSTPCHETVVHAGRGEVEFCLHAVGRPPAGLLDVQIAAGLAGAEYPASLSSLVSRFLDQKAAKHETRTDWRRRPLSKRQIEYALDDARWLPLLRNKIHDRLVELGRVEWLREEMDSWLESLDRSLSKERWRRVAGNASLNAQGLAIVRELHEWRDGEAQRRDCPVRRVLRDDLIVELARRGSADLKRIRAVRGLERGDLKRRLEDIADAIRRGLETPEPVENRPPSARERGPELSVLGQFLFAALGSVSRKARLSPNLVGSPGDIRQWMAHRAGGDRSWNGNPPKLARGWRAEFVGRLFDDILDGKVSVRVADGSSDAPLDFIRRPSTY